MGDVYRPIDSMTFPKEFALVGFYEPSHVQESINLLKREGVIDSVPVAAEEVKQWLLDLYPKP